MDREAVIQESIAGHQARNADLALRLKEKGADMNRIYAIEHHFWASNQRDAAHLAKRLYEKGYLITAIDRWSEMAVRRFGTSVLRFKGHRPRQ